MTSRQNIHHNNNTDHNTKIKHWNKFAYFWISSSLIAVIGYYLLWIIMPKHHVFGVFFRMITYHKDYPIPYIMICTFTFAIIASILSEKFEKASVINKIQILVIIVILSIIISSFFGGILWHYHDMRAGFFPENWPTKLLTKASLHGLNTGWFIILISFPYNLLGIITSYYILEYRKALMYRFETTINKK